MPSDCFEDAIDVLKSVIDGLELRKGASAVFPVTMHISNAIKAAREQVAIQQRTATRFDEVQA